MIGREPTFEELYEKVLAAQTKAIDASTGRVAVGSIDNAARSLLEQNGLGKYFTHRTGHGLGLEVHEAPYIIPAGDEILEPSMVFTVEPGVYFQGNTGVRIEDDVLVTQRGRRVLTNSLPKDFEWWR
jgi:Xaa-Pro dipeptidase